MIANDMALSDSLPAAPADPCAAGATAHVLTDVARWQAICDSNSALFADLKLGATMGIVSRSGFAGAGKHLAGLELAATRARGAPLLAWEASLEGLRVEVRAFEGFDRSGIDLLFVADDEALCELERSSPDTALPAMKRLLRRGNLMFYVFRTKHELQDAGYEDFLDSLGLAFLGACR
jgi:hypothetical protein